MTKRSLEQVVREYKQLGFEREIIKIAYENVNGHVDRIMDQIFRLQSQSSNFPVKPSNPQDEDAQLSKAIQMSITQAKDKKISLEPLNPQQRIRKSGIPVGLKNIGNTCYFNSLLQTYFQNSTFVREILKYEIPSKYLNLSKQQISSKCQQDFQFKRKYSSCKLVQSLKHIFAQMIGSDRKYVDPTQVLTSIVDDYGNQLPIGDQKDIGEFNLIFLSRIDQGLNQLYQKEKMEIQGQQNQNYGFEDSPSKLKVLGADDAFSQSASHSLLKRSSIKLNQGSMLSQQFIGRILNCFHNEKTNFHKQQSQLFSLLFVNVKNKQLNQALQQVVISNIEDYRNEKGEIVGVQKRIWIQQAPKTLFFQIDRVIFDKQKGQLHKINDVFDFPKQFYIDPFLYKNKQKALQIQHTVRKLRLQKQKYIEYLDQLQHYGKDKLNLLKTITLTQQFLQSQTSKMQVQQNNDPLIFHNLQQKITSSHIQLLKLYANQIEKKQTFYKQSIKNIQVKIQKCYQSIRTQPYHLYSILIHEGSAEMGHYYSYIYDVESDTWRKYNDINISDESPEKVFQQAKGINQTSAYYLVYAQKEVLVPKGAEYPMKNYKVSTDDQGYLKDSYSKYLSPEIRQKIMSQNYSMYNQIQQYKMGSLATRVIDTYAKKFQICNQTYRKAKPAQKKKNSAPILINLPLYMKNIDQTQYKNMLIQNAIQQYGPKQYSPAFDQILQKKLSNFNEFKRPKKFASSQKYYNSFMNDIYQCIAAQQIFSAIKQASYNKLFTLLTCLLNSQPGSYFNWLANLLTKTFIVHLLLQSQSTILTNQSDSIQKIKLMVLIMSKFINLNQQKALVNNCIVWLTELSVMHKQKENKQNCQKISEMISNRSYKGEFDQIFMKNQESQESVMNEIKSTIDIADACWNISRTQDVYITKMLQMREQVKQKIEAANQIYREMKKASLPLRKEDIQRIKNKKMNN